MRELVKVRCNGPNKHVNEVDLSAALLEVPITRGVDTSTAGLPDRIVLRCCECADGKVIVTRAMIEDARRRNPA